MYLIKFYVIDSSWEFLRIFLTMIGPNLFPAMPLPTYCLLLLKDIAPSLDPGIPSIMSDKGLVVHNEFNDEQI